MQQLVSQNMILQGLFEISTRIGHLNEAPELLLRVTCESIFWMYSCPVLILPFKYGWKGALQNPSLRESNKPRNLTHSVERFHLYGCILYERLGNSSRAFPRPWL